MKNRKTMAFILIILAGLLWGTSAIFVHYLTPLGVSSMQMTFVRGAVSTVVIGIYVLISNKNLFKVRISDLPFYIISGICMMMASVFYYLSMQRTCVSTSVVLLYIAPAYVMIYSVLFLKEKINLIKGLAVVLVIVGCALSSGVTGGMKYDTLGIIFGVLSGLSYGTYSVLTKYETERKCNSLTATFYSYTIMAISAMFIASPIEVVRLGAGSSVVALLMLGLGVCTFALPYFLYSVSMKYLPAGTASSLAVVEPLAATCYSVMLFGEELGIYKLLGIIAIVISVLLLSKTEE
ncbi:MAG: EamA family transporter [Clostridia bacterium]|nr:EamA family transporter [Clostridia bacterium]